MSEYACGPRSGPLGNGLLDKPSVDVHEQSLLAQRVIGHELDHLDVFLTCTLQFLLPTFMTGSALALRTTPANVLDQHLL